MDLLGESQTNKCAIFKQFKLNVEKWEILNYNKKVTDMSFSRQNCTWINKQGLRLHWNI